MELADGLRVHVCLCDEFGKRDLRGRVGKISSER